MIRNGKKREKEIKPGNKETGVSMRQNVNQVLMLILRGITRREDIHLTIKDLDNKTKISEKKTGWKIIAKSESQIDQYIYQAREIIAAEGKRTVAEVKNQYQAQLEDLYREARKIGNLTAAAGIIKILLYLTGIGQANVSETFSYITFDVRIGEAEEKAYQERLEAYCNIPAGEMLDDIRKNQN